MRKTKGKIRNILIAVEEHHRKLRKITYLASNGTFLTVLVSILNPAVLVDGFTLVTSLQQVPEECSSNWQAFCFRSFVFGN